MRATRVTGAGTGPAGWLRRHRPGATALLWTGSVTLLVADILAADLIPGPTTFWHPVAGALAVGSVLLFVGAAALGLRCLLHQRMRSAWLRRHRPGTPFPVDDEVIAREAARGITALEGFLARQKHTH